jgi:hypothetical protein
VGRPSITHSLGGHTHCYHSQAPMRRLVPNEPLYPCSTICQAQHPQTCSQAHEPSLPCNPSFDAIRPQTSYLSHLTLLAVICQKIHDMWFDPHLAWEHIHLLTKGESAHHKKMANMAMRLNNGTKATNASNRGYTGQLPPIYFSEKKKNKARVPRHVLG